MFKLEEMENSDNTLTLKKQLEERTRQLEEALDFINYLKAENARITKKTSSSSYYGILYERAIRNASIPGFIFLCANVFLSALNFYILYKLVVR